MAQVYTLVAEMEAIKADIAGMIAENQHRVQCGDAIAYDKDAFFNLRDQLDEITAMLRSEATGR